MEFIPLARPNIIDKDIKLVEEVLRSGMLVQGKYVQELEKAFTGLSGAGHASAVSNGTATLHLALKVLDIKPGDEVIVPAFSYVATANVVELAGARPVFVDIDPDTFNIKVSAIEAAITDRTKAIIPVHEFGLACDIKAVMAIAEKHGLYVIEDAACALGAKYRGQHVGTFGDFGSFSLHPRKAISSGEGGVLVTNSSSLDAKIKIFRNHGIETIDGAMEFTEFGFNYRMTDFQAALVYSQVDRLQAGIQHKRELALLYDQGLNRSGLKLPVTPQYTEHTWQTYHVIVDGSVSRDELIARLKEKQIGANYGAQCIPYVKAYADKYNHNCEADFPNALKAYKQGLALPVHELVTKQQVEYIINTLNNLIA